MLPSGAQTGKIIEHAIMLNPAPLVYSRAFQLSAYLN